MFTLIGPHRLHLFPDQTDRHARDENGDGQWRRGKMITAIHTVDLAGENHDQRKQNSDSSGKNFIDKKSSKFSNVNVKLELCCGRRVKLNDL